jgi:hypothetical protein
VNDFDSLAGSCRLRRKRRCAEPFPGGLSASKPQPGNYPTADPYAAASISWRDDSLNAAQLYRRAHRVCFPKANNVAAAGTITLSGFAYNYLRELRTDFGSGFAQSLLSVAINAVAGKSFSTALIINGKNRND